MARKKKGATSSPVTNPTRRNRRRKPAARDDVGFTMQRAIQPPTASGAIVGRPSPRFTQLSPRVTLISHTEVVSQPLTSATDISGSVCDLCPAGFPGWLSPVALNWSRWRWRCLRFIYVPQCPTTLSGTITMGITYDIQDTFPATLDAATQLYGSVTTPYWGGVDGAMSLADCRSPLRGNAVSVSVDLADNRIRPYVTSQTLASSADQILYSLGALVVFRQGGPATQQAAGIIFGQYEIELIDPVSASTNT